jgi:hypothetical protein
MKLLNLNHFEGWEYCTVDRCDQPKRGWDRGVGGLALVNHTVRYTPLYPPPRMSKH